MALTTLDQAPHTASQAGGAAPAWQMCDGRVQHGLTLDELSDASVVAGLESLVSAGLLRGREAFEAAAVQVITDCADSPQRAWQAFYRNSVAQLRDGSSPFAPVHRRARSLLAGESVLEVGCCFGFLALQCAQDGMAVSALDLCTGALDLLATAAEDFAVPLSTVYGDARALPCASESVDTVTLIHLLEHLDESEVPLALAEALRVARRRVVVAVPFEEQPSPHFGHLQRLTVDDLQRWAAPWTHCYAEIFTDHGGWLVLDKA